jgi:hypothetical protein
MRRYRVEMNTSEGWQTLTFGLTLHGAEKLMLRYAANGHTVRKASYTVRAVPSEHDDTPCLEDRAPLEHWTERGE